MITEINTKKGNYLIEFNNFNGTGWAKVVITGKIDRQTINKWLN